MRREQQVGAAPQRVAFRQRLRIGDVKSRANPARIERIDQRVGIHDRPARGIHQQRALPHQRELAAADQIRCDSAVEGRIRITISACGSRLSSSLTAWTSGSVRALRATRNISTLNGASMRSISLPMAP